MSSSKSRIEFVKTTVISGLVFLVPLVALIMVLSKAVDLMMTVARPMAALIPVDSVGGVALANVIAIIAVALICFLGGLLARSKFLRTAVEGLESKLLVKVPGYVFVKGMLSGLQHDEARRLIPVLATFGANSRIGLEIERLDDGRVVVLVPSSPNPWSGPVHIMTPDSVRQLSLTLPAYIETIQRFGQGTNELLNAEGTGGAGTPEAT